MCVAFEMACHAFLPSCLPAFLPSCLPAFLPSCLWTALPAFVPPNERRGLVLIDPPFEQKDEFERLADGFAEAYAKWPTGSYLLWYPVKSRRATDALARHVAGAAGASKPPGKCLRLEFSVAPQAAGGRPHLHRSFDRQPAVDAGGRTEDNFARTGKAARPGRRRPLQAGDAQTLIEPAA